MGKTRIKTDHYRLSVQGLIQQLMPTGEQPQIVGPRKAIYPMDFTPTVLNGQRIIYSRTSIADYIQS